MHLLQTLTAHTPWMSPAEGPLADTVMQQMREELQQLGLPETTTAQLRMHHVARALLMVNRAERALDAAGFSPDFGGVAANAAAAITCIGRAQDQLRKACKDFDDYCRRETAALAKAEKSAARAGDGKRNIPAHQHAAPPANPTMPPSAPADPAPQPLTPHLTLLEQPSTPQTTKPQSKRFSSPVYTPSYRQKK